MTVTLTAMHEQLRRDTARMLGLDHASLTAAQSVRLDRAVMLRLELDDCQTKKLAGQSFDTNKYVAASESLERLFGSDPEATTTPHDFKGAREELSNFPSSVPSASRHVKGSRKPRGCAIFVNVKSLHL
jgi:hypothetical protein